MASRVSGDTETRVEEDGDAAMHDVKEHGRPPGEPPDGSKISWAHRVSRSCGGGLPSPGRVMDDKFAEERVTMCFPNGEEGELVITVGEEVLDIMKGLWKRCLIVRVLGRTVQLATLTTRLRELWKPLEGMYVMDLPRNFFMVRFENEDEYLNALRGGPWKVFGSYLMVQRWTPEFDPLRDEIVTTPVWVRIIHLPVLYYHNGILMSIAKGVGKLVKVDSTTIMCERFIFARVCVEVNLKLPLKGSLLINGDRYMVAYEGLSNICSHCGIFGHAIHNCPRRAVERTSNPQTQIVPNSVRDAREGDGFVPVGRKADGIQDQVKKVGMSSGSVVNKSVVSSGEGRRSLAVIKSGKDVNHVVLSNRFGGLSNAVQDHNKNTVHAKNGDNKENELRVQVFTASNDANQRQASDVIKRDLFAKNGAKEVVRAKTMGSKKQGDKGFSRVHLNRPGRGLIFGPSKGELELSASGKRFRMESVPQGRAGGLFINGQEKQALGTSALKGQEASCDMVDGRASGDVGVVDTSLNAKAKLKDPSGGEMDTLSE